MGVSAPALLKAVCLGRMLRNESSRPHASPRVSIPQHHWEPIPGSKSLPGNLFSICLVGISHVSAHAWCPGVAMGRKRLSSGHPNTYTGYKEIETWVYRHLYTNMHICIHACIYIYI